MKRLALIALAWGVTAHAGETWECRLKSENLAPTSATASDNTVLVTAEADAQYSLGRIRLADVEYQAVYGMKGFDRRWDFGNDGNNAYNYTLIISPDGSGMYYDFSSARRSAPKMYFACALAAKTESKRKPSTDLLLQRSY
jgi:hypothetical protein